MCLVWEVLLGNLETKSLPFLDGERVLYSGALQFQISRVRCDSQVTLGLDSQIIPQVPLVERPAAYGGGSACEVTLHSCNPESGDNGSLSSFLRTSLLKSVSHKNNVNALNQGKQR